MVTSLAVFHLIFFSSVAFIIVIYILHRILGREIWYMPFVDLLSHFLGGASLIFLVWNGVQSFDESYSRELTEKKLSIELAPYRETFGLIQARRVEVCVVEPASPDCKALGHFIQSVAHGLVRGGVRLIPYDREPRSGASTETVALISEYERLYDTVPNPLGALTELSRHVNVWAFSLLTFAWMLGLYRRIQLLNTAIANRNRR